jgi:hypothetical protein
MAQIIKIGRDPANDNNIKGINYKLNTNDNFIGRHHAYISVESQSPLKLSLTALSVNKTYINGTAIENNAPKSITSDDVIQFVSTQSEPVAVKDILIFAKISIPVPRVTNEKKYKPDFLELKEIYTNYKTESVRLNKKETLINSLRTVVITLGGASATLFAFFAKDQSSTKILLSAGIPVVVVLLVTLILNKMSPRNQIVKLNDHFDENYISPCCSSPFGKTPWQVLAKQEKCKFCKTSWYEDNK